MLGVRNCSSTPFSSPRRSGASAPGSPGFEDGGGFAPVPPPSWRPSVVSSSEDDRRASIIEGTSGGGGVPGRGACWRCGSTRSAASSRLVLLVVDGSASMGAYERMARTKAGLRSILERVCVTRDRVAVQVFRGGRVELLVPPGRNIASARAAIEELPTGGGTPLAAALHGAATLLRHARLERPSESSLLVLVTDGRTRESARTAACDVGTVATTSMVLDTEVGPTRHGRARQIALWLGASYEVLP